MWGRSCLPFRQVLRRRTVQTPLGMHRARLVQPQNSSNDGVASCRFTKPLRAQLRRALLGREIHVDQPEAVAVAINPCEVVLRTPEEVSVHGDAVGSRTLQ